MPPIAREQIVAALQTVLDPEVGIDVIELGLVYGIAVIDGGVRLDMTMTSAACPLNSYFQEAVEWAIRSRIPQATAVELHWVWQPSWDPAMMSPEARRQMGWRT